MLTEYGLVVTYKYAPVLGNPSGENASNISIAAGGSGYWVARSDGSVQCFGAAPCAGSMANQHLNAPILQIVNAFQPTD